MNDHDTFKGVPGASALDARPPNGVRVIGTPVGRRYAPSNSRWSRPRATRGCRPLVISDTLRVSFIPRGAAQLAPR